MHNQNDLVVRLYNNGVTPKEISWNLKIQYITVCKILRENGILLERGANRKYQVNDKFEFSESLCFLNKGFLRTESSGPGHYWKATSSDPKKLEKIRKKLNSNHPIKRSGYNSYLLQINGKKFVERVQEYRKCNYVNSRS